MPSKRQRQISDGRSLDGRPPDVRPPDGRPPARRKWQLKYRAAALGIELLGAVLGFTLVGLWIDSQYGTSPWGLLICIIVGFIGGFYNLIRASLEALAASSGEASGEKISREGSERGPVANPGNPRGESQEKSAKSDDGDE